jgi:hypothetical protein
MSSTEEAKRMHAASSMYCQVVVGGIVKMVTYS